MVNSIRYGSMKSLLACKVNFYKIADFFEA